MINVLISILNLYNFYKKKNKNAGETYFFREMEPGRFFFLKYEIVYECKICKGSQTLILFSIRKSLRLIKVHFYRFYSR